MTKQGWRIIAFSVYKPLNRIVGCEAEPGIARPGAIQGPMPGGVPAEIDRTAPIALDDPALDGGTTLLGGSIAPKTQDNAETGKGSLLREGIASEAQPGRADDFLVRRPQPAAATDPAKTTALKP